MDTGLIIIVLINFLLCQTQGEPELKIHSGDSIKKVGKYPNKQLLIFLMEENPSLMRRMLKHHVKSGKETMPKSQGKLTIKFNRWMEMEEILMEIVRLRIEKLLKWNSQVNIEEISLMSNYQQKIKLESSWSRRLK